MQILKYSFPSFQTTVLLFFSRKEHSMLPAITDALNLWQLFTFQVERLISTLGPIGLFKPEHADPFRSRLPQTGCFLLVPPKPQRPDWSLLMQLVEFKGARGKYQLAPNALRDVTVMPDVPSLLTDVEDGTVRMGIKPSISEKNILRKKRFPYTVWHGIVHAIVFPEFLDTHGMHLLGSRCRSDNVLPRLFFFDGAPQLYAHWRDDPSPKYGAASYEKLILP